MSTRNKKNEIKIEQPITPETRNEVINKLVEEQAQVFDEKEEKFLESSVEEIEAQPVDEAEEPCVCDETCTCTEQECVDPACTCEKPEEPKVEPKEFHHEFQDEYHFGPGNGDAVIDTLPQEPVKAPEKQERKRKTFEQMTACEMNIYHKTGIIPFC